MEQWVKEVGYIQYNNGMLADIYRSTLISSFLIFRY